MTDDAVRPGAGFLTFLDRLLRPLEMAGLAISVALMLLVMVLISMDALMRYLFKAPLTFQFQLTEDYLLVGLVMMGLAWSFRTGGYIRISGLVSLLPHAVVNPVFRIGLLLSAGYIGAAAWMTGRKFLQLFRSGEAVIGVVDWPVYMSWIWLPVGLGLLTLRLILVALGPVEDLDIAHDDLDEL
ncbi:TRAP transporter small permease [Salipiger sp.]|uniref:TRAP transporter small permease n=1 Tax=Salipiger sp. TaxID=2078585 RepID=UPI003A982B8F